MIDGHTYTLHPHTYSLYLSHHYHIFQEGSTVAFASLVREMIDMKKIAIVRVIARKQGMPRFAALLPQANGVDEYGRF
jgi:hypothetical protein